MYFTFKLMSYCLLQEYISKYSKDKVTLNATLNAYLESNVPSNTLEASFGKQ